MKLNRITYIIVIALALLSIAEVEAQRMPERSLVRRGNRNYNKERYDRSIDLYTRASEVAPQSFEVAYNLGNALFRVERYEKAEQTMQRLLADSTQTETERSEVAYNLGNTKFAQQKLQEALDYYRTAMRLNPADMEAKYNYAYTKALLQQQQNEQNQDDEQNQDNDQQQNNNDQNQNQDKQNQDQNQNKNDQRNQDQQQQQSGASRQDQEAMLDAIQAQEDKTQDKLKEKTGVLIRGGKNW